MQNDNVKFKIIFLGILFFGIFGLAKSSRAGIISADRRVLWPGNVGVSAGIPNRTTICATLNPGATISQVQSAINNCPNGQVVYLNAGTYNLVVDIYNNLGLEMKTGVTLRGAGPGTLGTGVGGTTLIFSGAPNTHGNILFPGDVQESYLNTDANLKVDAIKGNTHVYLNSDPGWITAGHIYGIDRLDDPALSTGQGQEGGASYRQIMGNGARGMSQTVKVSSTTIDANGFKVNFEMPLAYGFETTYAAQIFKVAGAPIETAGVEDMYIESQWSANEVTVHQFKLQGASNCWIKNVESYNTPGGSHVWSFFSYRIEIRDSYFHHSFYYSGGQGYGVAPYHGSTGWLVENNIFNHLHAPMIIDYGGSYNVFAYNYEFGGYSASGQNAGIATHGTHTYMTLFEGNYIADNALFDWTHGSGSHQTVFRNRIMSNGTNPAINIYKYNRYLNIVGNIIGVNTSQNYYMLSCPADCGPHAPIFGLGWDQLCNAGAFGGCDSIVTAIDSTHTLIHGNYDYVNNAIRWDSGITDHTLPNSLYLGSKPYFFGNCAWPPMDPGGPTINDIPAKRRYDGNPCVTGGTDTTPPAAPTGLAVN